MSLVSTHRDLRITVLAWRDRWHDEAGGSEVYLEQILRRLAQAGHEITYVTAANGRPQREQRNGIRYLRGGNRLSVYPRGLLSLLRQRPRPDLVVDVINGVPFFSPLVRRAPIVALVHHVHREQWRMIYPDWRGRVGWWVESRVVPKLYGRRPILTVSQATREDLVRLGIPSENVSVVRNAQDRPRVAPSASQAATPRVVCVGRLVPHKQIDHALNTVAVLAEDHPALALDIVGEGSWRASLEDHVHDLGLEDRVTFHGHVSDEERSAIVQRAWVHLFPAVKEGWGLVVGEAGAHGVPTVAYRSAGGVRESVRDGETGLLVDSSDQFTAAVRSLLEDPQLRTRLGEQARQTALSRTWDSAAEEFAAAAVQWVSGRRRR